MSADAEFLRIAQFKKRLAKVLPYFWRVEELYSNLKKINCAWMSRRPKELLFKKTKELLNSVSNFYTSFPEELNQDMSELISAHASEKSLIQIKQCLTKVMGEINSRMTKKYGKSWRNPNIGDFVYRLFKNFDPILDMKSNRVATLYLHQIDNGNGPILKYILERALCVDQIFAVIDLRCIYKDSDKNDLSFLLTDVKLESRNYIPSGAPLIQYTKQESDQEATGTIGAIVGLPTRFEVKLGIVSAEHNFTTEYMNHCNSSHEFSPYPVADECGNDIAVVEFSEQWLIGNNCCNNAVRFTESFEGIGSDEQITEDSDQQYPDASEFDDAMSQVMAVGGGFSFDSITVANSNIMHHAQRDFHQNERVISLNYLSHCYVNNYFYLFKLGSITGLTVGTLCNKLCIHTYNHGKPVYVVEWSEGTIFAVNGDCGSVYFYESKGSFVPIGIHLASGKLNGKNVSIGAPLEDINFPGYEEGIVWEPNCENYPNFDYSSTVQLEEFRT